MKNSSRISNKAAAATTKLKKKKQQENKSETEREIFETANSRVSIECLSYVFIFLHYVKRKSLCLSFFLYFILLTVRQNDSIA